jgi:hypothetical protein
MMRSSSFVCGRAPNAAADQRLWGEYHRDVLKAASLALM